MNDINSCILVGRLTRDGELTYTQNGKAVLKITLAVNRSIKQGDQWTDETAFFDVTCWGVMAEGLKQRIGRGSQVGVVGRLCQDRWKDSQGQNRTKIYILAETVEVLKGLQKDGQSHYGNPQNQQDYSQDYQQGEMNYGG